MNLPDILNVAIGLVLLFFLLSTIASLLVELITTAAHYREEILQVTVQRLLLGGPDKPWRIGTLLYDQAVAWVVPDVPALQAVRTKLRPDDTIGRGVGDERAQALLRAFWQHPKIRSLVPNNAQAPAALTADVFAQVLVDISVPRNSQGELPDNRLTLDRALAAEVAGLPDSLQHTLRGLLQASEIPAGAAGEGLWRPFRAGIAAWYDEAANQATDIYRQKTKRLLFFIGVLLAAGLNADTVRAARDLAQDSSLREATAAYAGNLVADKAKQAGTEANPKAKPTTQELKETIGYLRDVEGLGFPLGWTGAEWNRLMARTPAGATEPVPQAPGGRRGQILLNFLLKFLGLAATGLAVTQGGPFWYDLMQKLIGLRKGAGGDKDDQKDGAKAPAPNAAGSPVAAPAKVTLEIGHDLSAPATGFAPRKAYWLARASAAAYLPAAEVTVLVKQDWLFPEFEFFDVGGSQAFVAADERVLIVAFRGTELSDLRDIVADAEIKLQPLAAAGPGKVHKGFCGYYDKLAGSLTAKVDALIAANPARQVYVTGHSLGGGMATVMFALYASAWTRAQTAKAVGSPAITALPTLYTYGCPRVGDEQFSKALDRLYPGRVFRLENDIDLVPEVPPMPYHHIGQRMHFDAQGKLEAGISGLSVFLNEVQVAVGTASLKDFTAAKLEAHAVTHYVARCKQHASQPA